MQQVGDKWLDWRKKGIGSSDVPVILKEQLKYSTPYKLWQLKTDRIRRENTSSFVAELGHKFEPQIRSNFNLLNDLDLECMCAEHDQFDFLRCSFDGMDEAAKVFMEIKYVGQDRFDWVKENKKVLPDHQGQIDMQFIVSGYDDGYYTVYTLNKERTMIDEIYDLEIKPDKERIEKLTLPEIFKFWNCIKNDKPPERVLKDMDKEDQKKMNSLSTKWAKLIKNREELDLELLQIENDLINGAEKYDIKKLELKKCTVINFETIEEVK